MIMFFSVRPSTRQQSYECLTSEHLLMADDPAPEQPTWALKIAFLRYISCHFLLPGSSMCHGYVLQFLFGEKM
jgi:hypothetical protein